MVNWRSPNGRMDGEELYFENGELTRKESLGKWQVH